MPDRVRAPASLAPPPGVPTTAACLGGPLLDAGFLADPYPTYRRLRESAPLVWSDEFFGGAWLVSRHADVDMVLRDARFSAQRTGGWVMRGHGPRGELRGFQRLFARAMIFLDAPDHLRIRQVLSTAFRASDLQRLVPRLDQAITDRLDTIDAHAGFDFVSSVARPLPAQAIAMLMGVEPHAATGEFMAGSDELADFLGASEPTREQALHAQAALLSMAAAFDAALQRRRREGEDPARDDILDRLLRAESAGQIRGSAELLAQCVMLLFAGHETTRHLLANGLQILLAQPGAWHALRNDRSLLSAAVRELLRFDSPVQYTGRRVAAPLRLHGQNLRRGDLVVALIGAANRDPGQYERPDELDFTRRAAPSLAFGQGPHVCLGAALTLLEAQAVWGQMLDRWPGLELACPGPPSRMGSPLYRGPLELPVRQALAGTGRQPAAYTASDIH
jgi:cytochrome P450